MSTNANSSAQKVAVGTRKLPSACALAVKLLLGQNEDEQHREREVDEVHRLDQTHGQEEQCLQAALRFGLASHALDQRATGETVTDRSADGTAAQRHAPAYEGTSQRNGLGRYLDGHFSPLLYGWLYPDQCAPSSSAGLTVLKYKIVSRAKMNAWISPMNISNSFQIISGAHRM